QCILQLQNGDLKMDVRFGRNRIASCFLISRTLQFLMQKNCYLSSDNPLKNIIHIQLQLQLNICIPQNPVQNCSNAVCQKHQT
ncbi:MAG: hypothetical protein MJA29_09595, partial [Candidatus Omnitrophica bacterium]|nr:hypothetical protein [Candidatus Omnitrophota bacterium]